MIDVCFSSCTEGNLRAIAYEFGNPIKTDGILSLAFQFNYGYLNGDIYQTQAWREASAGKYFYKDITPQEMNDAYEEELETIKVSLSRLDKYLKSGEDIRLWVGQSARDRCGLCWFCNYIKNCSNNIYTVSCPGYELDLFKNMLIENTHCFS